MAKCMSVAMVLSRVGQANQNTIIKVSNPAKLMRKRNVVKPHTIQHKSEKGTLLEEFL